MLLPAPLPLAPPATARFQQKRDTILAAAARQFNAQGIKGATLAEIAGSVGLVTTSITYYYRRKDDLATACFVPAIAAHQRVALAAAAEPTVARWLAGFVGLHARRLAAIASGQQPAASSHRRSCSMTSAPCPMPRRPRCLPLTPICSGRCGRCWPGPRAPGRARLAE